MSESRRDRLGRSGVDVLEHERRVCPAKTERVRKRRTQLYVVPARAHDRHVRECRVDLIDMCALADEAVLYHQQGINGLVRAGRALGMSGQRLRRRDRRTFVGWPKHLAERLDLLEVADGGRSRMGVDI